MKAIPRHLEIEPAEKNLTEFEELWKNFTADGLEEKDDVNDNNFDPEAAIYKRKLLMKRIFSDKRPANTV